MNERLRAILLGLGLGLAPLLLLDLARILTEASVRDLGETSMWWPIACYAGVGLVVALGVAAGRRDRSVPLVGALVVLLAVLPALPTTAVSWLPTLPLATTTGTAQALAIATIGAYAYSAVRGTRS